MLKTFLASFALTLPMIAHAQETPPAAVVVAFDSETITPLIAEGTRNRETSEAVEFNDPVRIASISKLIMALATLKLVDEGKVELNADVSDYLGFPVRSPHHPDAPVTLAQILSHRSALRDNAGYIIPLGESLEEKLADPEAWYADAPPGEAPFEYANLGSPVVATALEAASGERYDAILERTIFGPIGIEACVNWIGCSDDMVARAVALYRDTGEEARDFPADLPPNCSFPVAEGNECSLSTYVPGTNASVFSPQGGVRIGMMDLAKIGQALLKRGGVLLSEEALTPMRDSAGMGVEAFLKDGSVQEFFCIYGLGIQVIGWEGSTCSDGLFGKSEPYIGHSGEAYALQSGLWFDGRGKNGFVYFRTQAPAPAGGEDTGGFSDAEKGLMKRARKVLDEKRAQEESQAPQ